ncbi:Tetratricopeptide repeat protein 17 [Chamberlinius hualienensis]
MAARDRSCVMGVHRFYSFLFILILLLSSVKAATHWVVTEDGKIQEQIYSVFYMKRPYDLVALMQQETRAQLVQNFMGQLDGHIEEIDSKTERDSKLHDKFYQRERDCIIAERPLTEYNLYVGTITTCTEMETSIRSLYSKERPKEPRYSQPSCLQDIANFSKGEYDHLQALKNVNNLTMAADPDVMELLAGIVENADEFGYLLHHALQENSASWTLYNMAGYFFRFVGEAQKAVDCIRRAIHLAPTESKHVALLNLGNVLHQSQQSEDASVVVLAAIEISSHDPILHYALGNIYAVLTRYNNSIASFNTSVELHPTFIQAKLRKHAVICHSKLEASLEAQLESLQKTLIELGDFEHKLDFWQKQQVKLSQEQVPLDIRLAAQIDYAEWKIRQQLQTEMQKLQKPFDGDETGAKAASNKMIDCTVLNGGTSSCVLQPMVVNVKMPIDDSYKYLFKEVEIQTTKLREELISKQSEIVSRLNFVVSGDQSKLNMNVKYPRKFRNPSEPPPKYLLPDWPSDSECQLIDTKSDLNVSLPAFIPPENKGFMVGQILSRLSQVSPVESPPVCNWDSAAGIVNIHDWFFSNSEEIMEDFEGAKKELEAYIHEHCGVISLNEFGKRLTVALNEELVPKWLLYHLAFFYWWSVGDFGHCSKCLLNISLLAPRMCKDLILVPTASFLGRGGLLPGAIYLANFALKFNEFEPVTNKLLGDLYVLSGELEKAMTHYKKVLHEEPDDKVALRNYQWVMCRLKLNNGEQPKVQTRKETTLNSPHGLPPLWIDLDEDSLDGHCFALDQEGKNCINSFGPNQIPAVQENKEVEDESVLIKLDEEEDPENVPEVKEAQTIHLKLASGQATRKQVADDPLPDMLLEVNTGFEKSNFDQTFHCHAFPQANFKQFTSTWLSVSAKGVAVGRLLDLTTPLSGPTLQPFCNANLPSSALTLDHLSGMKHRADLVYTAETGLREALQTLGLEGGTEFESVENMGTRLAYALKKNSTSWTVVTLAALYWRVVGNVEQAIICLREALHYAPREMRDIPLVSLANIFHRAGLLNNALVVANMALEISPKVVVIHFTLANIFAARDNMVQAKAFYDRAKIFMELN